MIKGDASPTLKWVRYPGARAYQPSDSHTTLWASAAKNLMHKVILLIPYGSSQREQNTALKI